MKYLAVFSSCGLFLMAALMLSLDVRVDNVLISKAIAVCTNNGGLTNIFHDNLRHTFPEVVCNNGAVFELEEDKQ